MNEHNSMTVYLRFTPNPQAIITVHHRCFKQLEISVETTVLQRFQWGAVAQLVECIDWGSKSC